MFKSFKTTQFACYVGYVVQAIIVNFLPLLYVYISTDYGISFENGKNHFKVNGIIKPNMKNSDVRQITKGLILSPTGECLAEPILLIDYYDVKAYHGATIGKISDDDLFYLMSRGLTKEEAFMLIINGLLEPFVKNLNDESIKEEVMNSYYSYF